MVAPDDCDSAVSCIDSLGAHDIGKRRHAMLCRRSKGFSTREWNISQAYDILVFTSKTATSSPIYESIRSIQIKTGESRTNIKFI